MNRFEIKLLFEKANEIVGSRHSEHRGLDSNAKITFYYNRKKLSFSHKGS